MRVNCKYLLLLFTMVWFTISMNAQQQMQTDTLIVTDENKLLEGVRQIVNAILDTEPQNVVSDSDQLLLLTYLLNQRSFLPVGNVSVLPSSNSNERLDRIEALLTQLLRAKNTTNSSTPIIMPQLILPQNEQKTTVPVVSTSVKPQVKVIRDTIRTQEERLVTDVRVVRDTIYQPVVVEKTPQVQIIRDTTVLRSTQQSRIGYMRQVFFEQGKAILSSASKIALSDVLATMKYSSDAQFVLTGYASPEGNALLNKKLAEKRCRAVYQYLVSNGIDPNRLRIHLGGVDNTRQPKAIGRRVDIVMQF